MKNITRSVGGTYDVKGKKYPMLIGTRAQVWHETAYKTSGGLTKNNLVKNKSGRIVSKSKYFSAKKEKRLLKHGYGYTKGKFVPSTHTKKHHKKRRGGDPTLQEQTQATADKIGDATKEGFSKVSNATKEGFSKVSNATKEGFSKVSDATKQMVDKSKEESEKMVKKTSSFFSNLFNMGDKKGGSKSRKMRGGIYSQGSGNVASQAASWNSQKYGNDMAPGNLNLLATNYSGGGRRRRMRGGIYSQGSGNVASQAETWNSSKWGNDMAPGNLNLLATNYGGRSRRRRKMRGGIYGQGAGNVASQAETWNSSKWGKDMAPGNLNLLATNYGGRRTRRRKSRGGNPPMKGSTHVSQNAAPVKPTK